MARHVLSRLTLVLAVSVVFGGCTAAGPMLDVLRGNLAYARGDYQTALVYYLAGSRVSGQEAWVLFNTGNVYYALGEQDAALRAWDEARRLAEGADMTVGRRSSRISLIHAASYNRGVTLFQRGEYRLSYEEFRYALEVDSRSTSAKTNLELALTRLRAAESAEQLPAPTPGEPDTAGVEPQTLRILEYVRRKEAQRWYAGRESAPPSDPRDW